MSRGERKAMITRDAPELSLSRQCRLLSIGRSSFYYAPRGESPSSLALMRRIDELFMKYPFYGSRQMVRQLRRDGVCVGRHRVRRLMRLIGLEAIYQAPRTSVPHPMHRIYPYLLKGMAIDQPNRVWCADITYIPVQRGFLYLVAIMDWTTRWPATASRRYSIRIRAASSPASTSPACSRTRASASPWTVGAAAWTTSSSSACGGLSSMRRSTYTSSPTASTPTGSSASGSASTTPSGPIRPSTVKRRPRPTGPVNLWI